MTLEPFQVQDASRFRVETEIRYADLDPNEHVNHARYLIYLEEARLAYRRLLDREIGLPEHVTWPIAELTIRYLRSASYPGRLTVELAPVHVGRTSFTLGYGIFDLAGCVAVASNRSVCVDRSTGRPMPIPPLSRRSTGLAGREKTPLTTGKNGPGHHEGPKTADFRAKGAKFRCPTRAVMVWSTCYKS
jgi:acyl-CoA thioester hydrolase